MRFGVGYRPAAARRRSVRPSTRLSSRRGVLRIELAAANPAEPGTRSRRS
jgi:hypothetical protein